jgi:hypothetical protein
MAEVAPALFGAAYDIADGGSDAVALAAEAVWGASELNGGQLTLTGTLAQLGEDDWTYSLAPVDRLELIFLDGSRLSLIFASFDGYLDGSWEDFVDQHALDFRIVVDGRSDIRVQSQSVYTAEFTMAGERLLTGTAWHDGEPWTVNMTHTATLFRQVESGWLQAQYDEAMIGSAISPGMDLNINQTSWIEFIQTTAFPPRHLRNDIRRNNSSATVGGSFYRMDDAGAKWAIGTWFNDGIFNAVSDPGYWFLQNGMSKDGQPVGQLAWDGPVLEYGIKPNLVLEVQQGGQVVLLNLPTVTPTAIDDLLEVPEDLVLLGNYPNPFNPATTIVYELPEAADVRLVVSDLLGRAVRVVDSGLQAAGRHETFFDASGLPSGLYTYRLSAGPASRASTFVLTR